MIRLSIGTAAGVLAVLSGLSQPAFAAGPSSQDASPSPIVEPYLRNGELAAAEEALVSRLGEHPGDDRARFSLGVVRVLRGGERLVQSLHTYGMRSRPGGAPFVRLPVPPNLEPEEIRYEDARNVCRRLIADLSKAEATLAEVDDPNVKLPIRVGQIRLDFDGNGEAGDQETFWLIYRRITPGVHVSPKDAEQFVVCLDRGDVDWLRAYCHLLTGLCEMELAYDERECFQRTAHLLFPRVDSPYDFLDHPRKPFPVGEHADVSDLIAMVHLVRFSLEEPVRMQAALDHFEQVVKLSRSSWKFILSETDDDREWIPNPKQKGVIPGVRVTQGMVDRWHELLDEVEALLAGEKLVPFWRGDPELGVNLRRVFTEPRQFDLVLWVQGTDASPYLEKGELTRPEFWRRLQQTFRGNLMGFAIWFN
jgi:hypothetical protein